MRYLYSYVCWTDGKYIHDIPEFTANARVLQHDIAGRGIYTFSSMRVVL